MAGTSVARQVDGATGMRDRTGGRDQTGMDVVDGTIAVPTVGIEVKDKSLKSKARL